MAELITESNQHRTLHAAEFVRRRGERGLTLKQMAEKLGSVMGKEPFSATTIWRFEEKDREITTELAEAIEAVLRG